MKRTATYPSSWAAREAIENHVKEGWIVANIWKLTDTPIGMDGESVMLIVTYEKEKV